MTGIELIAAERQRQITDEGWTAEHDDQWPYGTLAEAAACYASKQRTADGFSPDGWPWDEEWWKPTPLDRIRELTKAGALIAAEIDRLQRAKEKQG